MMLMIDDTPSDKKTLPREFISRERRLCPSSRSCFNAEPERENAKSNTHNNNNTETQQQWQNSILLDARLLQPDREREKQKQWSKTTLRSFLCSTHRHLPLLIPPVPVDVLVLNWEEECIWIWWRSANERMRDVYLILFVFFYLYRYRVNDGLTNADGWLF